MFAGTPRCVNTNTNNNNQGNEVFFETRDLRRIKNPALLTSRSSVFQNCLRQDWIPVGCVPTVAVTLWRGGGCSHYTLQPVYTYHFLHRLMDKMGSESNMSVKHSVTFDTTLISDDNFEGDFDGHGHGDRPLTGTMVGLYYQPLFRSRSRSLFLSRFSSVWINHKDYLIYLLKKHCISINTAVSYLSW